MLFVSVLISSCGSTPTVEEIRVEVTQLPTKPTGTPEANQTPTTDEIKETHTIPQQEITYLMEEGIIDVEAYGDNIEKIKLRIRRLKEEEIGVVIPAGTYFESKSKQVQNMVSRRTEIINLQDDSWKDVEVLVGCANRERIIPNSSHTFTIRKSPNQYELSLLANILDEFDLDFDVVQAAIWIISDNSNFDDLGILVRNNMFRSISYEDTAQAMKIIDEAGIDITNRAIWEDREIILDEVRNDEIKDWLLEREFQGPPTVSEILQSGSGKVLSYNERIYEIAYSPSSDKVAGTTCTSFVGGSCIEGKVAIWDVATGEKITDIEGHKNRPYGVDWSPNGKIVASGSCQDFDEEGICRKGEIFLWEPLSGEKIGSLDGATDLVRSLRFSPNGRYLISPQCIEKDVAFYLLCDPGTFFCLGS